MKEEEEQKEEGSRLLKPYSLCDVRNKNINKSPPIISSVFFSKIIPITKICMYVTGKEVVLVEASVPAGEEAWTSQ